MLKPSTSRCEICGETRPDALISTSVQYPWFSDSPSVQWEWNHCNDRPACVDAAPELNPLRPKRRLGPARPPISHPARPPASPGRLLA